MNNTIFASPHNKGNRNKLYSSLDTTLNKDLANINSEQPVRTSLPKIKKNFVKSMVINNFENQSQMIGLKPEMTP